MAKRSYDEMKVVRALNCKASINVKGQLIEVARDAVDVGIGSWGKIDFLVHYKGYVVMRPAKLSAKRFVMFDNDEDNTTKVRHSKRDKVNIAGMVSSTMKNKHK